MLSADKQFYTGVFFAAVGLLFLWRAFQFEGRLNDLQYDIVHYVCASSAGASGAFFTGAAVLSYDATMGPGNRFAFQGTAGVALFALVFLIFRLRFKPTHGQASTGPPGAWISIGTNTPFAQAAEALADEAGASIDLSELTDDERSVVPRSERLACGTLNAAKGSLEKLAGLVPAGRVRPYTIELDSAHKRFTLTPNP